MGGTYHFVLSPSWVDDRLGFAVIVVRHDV